MEPLGSFDPPSPHIHTLVQLYPSFLFGAVLRCTNPMAQHQAEISINLGCVSSTWDVSNQPGMCPTAAQHQQQNRGWAQPLLWKTAQKGKLKPKISSFLSQKRCWMGATGAMWACAGAVRGWRAAGSRFWQLSAFLTGSVQDHGHQVTRFC